MKWPLWCLQIEMIEVRTCVKINMWCQYVEHDFMWLVKWRDWYSGVRAIGPEYGQLYGFGLINYVYYACKLRGLSAFSGERDSLLRCVGGDGEAGASYMNKWFNCYPALFPDSLPRISTIVMCILGWEIHAWEGMTRVWKSTSKANNGNLNCSQVVR